MLDSSKQTVERFVVIGAMGKFSDPLPEGVTLCRASNLKTCVQDAWSGAVFISCASGSTDALLKARLKAKSGRRLEQLLTMEPPRTESVPALLGVFGKVIGLAWVPAERAQDGTALAISDAGRTFSASVVTEPFYDPAGAALRS